MVKNLLALLTTWFREYQKRNFFSRIVEHSVIVVAVCHCINYLLNHFSTTGRCSGPAHYDVSIRQAARATFVTSSFKIFLTQTFPRCGATCYNIYIAFEGDDSAIQWCQLCLSLSGSLLNILQLFGSFSQNPKLIQWRTVLTTLAICPVMFYIIRPFI